MIASEMLEIEHARRKYIAGRLFKKMQIIKSTCEIEMRHRFCLGKKLEVEYFRFSCEIN